VILGAIGLRRVNLNWLRQVGEALPCLVVIQRPANMRFIKYADYYFVSRRDLGFGTARALSMELCSKLDTKCIVTDGDGQYPHSSISKFAKALSATTKEVLIPQRTNRSVWIRVEGSMVDRSEIEDFENYCALRDLGGFRVPTNFDMQPGLFGFKSSVLPLIRPDEPGWLADWEIGLKVIRHTKFATIPLDTEPKIQEVTTFTLRDEVEKLRKMQSHLHSSLSRICREYEKRFEPKQKGLLRKLVSDAQKRTVR
jgi:hypothetical protein